MANGQSQGRAWNFNNKAADDEVGAAAARRVRFLLPLELLMAGYLRLQAFYCTSKASIYRLCASIYERFDSQHATHTEYNLIVVIL
jgi:hypothetical protein